MHVSKPSSGGTKQNNCLEPNQGYFWSAPDKATSSCRLGGIFFSSSLGRPLLICVAMVSDRCINRPTNCGRLLFSLLSLVCAI